MRNIYLAARIPLGHLAVQPPLMAIYPTHARLTRLIGLNTFWDVRI